MWSQARHSALSSGFYGNKMGFVRGLPTPPPSAGPVPASQHCICVVNFSSVLFTPPAPDYPQQQHPSPQTRKEKRTHSLWAELRHHKGIQATGSQRTAQESHAHHSVLSCLISYSLPQATQNFNSRTLFMPNTHHTQL